MEVRCGPEKHSCALFEEETCSCFPTAPLPPRRAAAVRAGRSSSRIAGGPGVELPRPRHVDGAPVPHHRPARAERRRAESRLLRADSGRQRRLCTGSWSARTAELAPKLDEDFRMMRLVVSATFFPSYGLAPGSGELIRRSVADRAFSAVARLRSSGQVNTEAVFSTTSAATHPFHGHSAPISRRGSVPVTLHSPEQLAFTSLAGLARRSCTGEKAGTVNTRFRAAQDAHEAPHVRLGVADRKRRRGRRRQLPCPLFGHVPTWS